MLDLLAGNVEEAGVSGVHRPKYPAGRIIRRAPAGVSGRRLFGELSPGVTTYGIQIGYTPETSRILLPPHWTGVSGPAGDSGVHQPETPGAVSG